MWCELSPMQMEHVQIHLPFNAIYAPCPHPKGHPLSLAFQVPRQTTGASSPQSWCGSPHVSFLRDAVIFIHFSVCPDELFSHNWLLVYLKGTSTFRPASTPPKGPLVLAWPRRAPHEATEPVVPTPTPCSSIPPGMAGGSIEGSSCLWAFFWLFAELRELSKVKPKSLSGPRTYWEQYGTMGYQQVMACPSGWLLGVGHMHPNVWSLHQQYANNLCPNKPRNSNLEALAFTTSAPWIDQ